MDYKNHPQEASSAKIRDNRDVLTLAHGETSNWILYDLDENPAHVPTIIIYSEQSQSQHEGDEPYPQKLEEQYEEEKSLPAHVPAPKSANPYLTRCMTPEEYRDMVDQIDYSPIMETSIREEFMKTLSNDLQGNQYDYIAHILVKLPYSAVLDFMDFFYETRHLSMDMVRSYARGAGSACNAIMSLKGFEPAQIFAESMASCSSLAMELKQTFEGITPNLQQLSKAITNTHKEMAGLQAEINTIKIRLRDPVTITLPTQSSPVKPWTEVLQRGDFSITTDNGKTTRIVSHASSKVAGQVVTLYNEFLEYVPKFDLLSQHDPLEVLRLIKTEFKRTKDLPKAARDVTDLLLVSYRAPR